MNPRTKVNVDTYREDRLYPRAAQAVEELLAKGNVVAPVDVLVHMELLKPKRLEVWCQGELWHVRVLPPPVPGLEGHVVFTTPYLLIKPSEHEWQAYFRRTLPDAPSVERIAKYEHHMKFGPARDYWSEFVFEAYVNHRSDVIFLAGLPDVAESRPHSRVNSQ